MNLARRRVEELIGGLLSRLPREACLTCDCLLGFITQIELDVEDDVSDITFPLTYGTSC